MKADDPRHGTDAGYQTHRRDGESACQPCREAHTARMGELRKGRGRTVGEQVYGAARSRALVRLARMYPDVFDGIMREELSLASDAVRNREAS